MANGTELKAVEKKIPHAVAAFMTNTTQIKTVVNANAVARKPDIQYEITTKTTGSKIIAGNLSFKVWKKMKIKLLLVRLESTIQRVLRSGSLCKEYIKKSLFQIVK